jgi:hypothetical protein
MADVIPEKSGNNAGDETQQPDGRIVTAKTACAQVLRYEIRREIAAFLLLFMWQAPPWLVVILSAIGGAALTYL